MKLHALRLLSVSLFLLVAACGGAGGAVGLYDLDVDAFLAQTPNLPAELKAKMQESAGGTLELKADKTYVFWSKDMATKQQTGTWERTGERLTVTKATGEKELWTLRNGVLSCTVSLMGPKVALRFEKR